MIDKEKIVNFFKGDDLAAEVFLSKYSHNQEEMPWETTKRVANAFINKFKERRIDKEKLSQLSNYGQLFFEDPAYIESFWHFLLSDFENIIPGGSVLSSVGTDTMASLSNCFVLDSPKDTISSIVNTARDMAQIYKHRGGVGIDLSYLRPNGAKVNNTAKASTGPTSFMSLYSTITEVVSQLGRRGALMLTMDVDHPDALEFATIKRDLTKVTGANISLKLNDNFLYAVREDADYYQTWPVDYENIYRNEINADHLYAFMDALEYDKLTPYKVGKGIIYYKRIKARKLWDVIIESNWLSAEPGIMNWERILSYDPTSIYPELRPISTNPCLPDSVLLFTRDGLKKLKDVKIGEQIWSKEGWTTITNIQYSGEKDVYRYTTKIGYLDCTNNHRIVSKGEKKEIKDADSIDLVYSVEMQLLRECLNKPMNGSMQELRPDSLKILSSKKLGTDDVYDITVDNDSHTFWCNGYDVCNCGELPLGAYDSCRLISVNLYSMVTNPFTNPEFDYKAAYKVFYNAQVLADVLVDLEIEAVDRILAKVGNKETEQNAAVHIINPASNNTENDEYALWSKVKSIAALGRRTGTGITGLGDLYAAMNLPYGDEDFTQKVFELKLMAELDASTDMAKLFGAFPLWYNYDQLIKNIAYKNITKGTSGYEWYDFIFAHYPAQAEDMYNTGLRNAGISTCAPTGSISILTQTTSGIEPLFQPYYTRRRKCNPGEKADFIDQNGVGFVEYMVIHQPYKEWLRVKKKWHKDITYEELEKYFVESPWYGQTSSDLDMKKRIDTQALIQKYITSSISSTINLPETATKEQMSEGYLYAMRRGCKGVTYYREGSRSGILISNKKDNFPYHEAPKRPKELPAYLHLSKSKGNTYAVIIGLYENKPYEVFVFNCFGLKLKEAPGKIIKVKKGVYSFEGSDFTIDNISEMFNSDEERMCALYTSMLLRHGANIHYVIKTAKKVNEEITSFVSAMSRILSKYDSITEILECPECKGKLIKENGCTHCIDCGYSAC